MILYFIPFIFLLGLISIESRNKLSYIIKNKYFYYLISLFFIFFIGLRDEIGCDWNQYKAMFNKYNDFGLIEILKNNISSKETLQELGHILLTSISQNIYILNTIYSIIFIFPLFYFCSKFRRPYFCLLLSYPYYIVVIGMGPIRQAACISLLMLSMIFVKNKNYYCHLLISIITALIHQSSILFNGIILGSILNKIKEIKFSRKNILIIFLLTLVFLY